MRLLCINYEYPPVGGGGASVCQTLVQTLAENGHEIDVVTSGMKDLPRTDTDGRVRVFRVPCVRRNRFYSTIPELATQILPSYLKALELARVRNYDCNQTHFIVPSGIVAYMLKRATGLPYVITAHGSDIPGYNPDRFRWAHKLIQPVWRRVISNSDAVTSASEFLRDLIHQKIDHPVSVIPNAYDLPSYDTAQKEKRVLVAARLVERKGVQFLIEASDAIGDDWELCVAGDGPYLSTLKRMAQDVAKPIRFLGFLNHQELERLYLSSRIFVFPSLQENFPMVLLEAMAAECAFITTTARGCVEVVGDAAITVSPGSVGELRGALARLTSNPEESEHRAQLSKRRAARFSSAHVSGQLESLFRQVAHESGGSG